MQFKKSLYSHTVRLIILQAYFPGFILIKIRKKFEIPILIVLNAVIDGCFLSNLCRELKFITNFYALKVQNLSTLCIQKRKQSICFLFIYSKLRLVAVLF